MCFLITSHIFLMYSSSISWEDVSQGEHSERRMAGNQPAASQECFPCPTIVLATLSIHTTPQLSAVLSFSSIYIDMFSIPTVLLAMHCFQYSMLLNSVHTVSIASLNTLCIHCALYTCPCMDSVHSILSVCTPYTPHILPVYSPYAPFYLIVSSVNSSESRCFPEQITWVQKKMFPILENQKIYESGDSSFLRINVIERRTE